MYILHILAFLSALLPVCRGVSMCRDGFQKRSLTFSNVQAEKFGVFFKPKTGGQAAIDAVKGSGKTYRVTHTPTNFTIKSKVPGQRLFYMREVCLETVCNDKIVIARISPSGDGKPLVPTRLGEIRLINKNTWHRVCFFVNVEMKKLSLQFEPSTQSRCPATVRKISGKACVKLRRKTVE